MPKHNQTRTFHNLNHVFRIVTTTAIVWSALLPVSCSGSHPRASQEYGRTRRRWELMIESGDKRKSHLYDCCIFIFHIHLSHPSDQSFWDFCVQCCFSLCNNWCYLAWNWWLRYNEYCDNIFTALEKIVSEGRQVTACDFNPRSKKSSRSPLCGKHGHFRDGVCASLSRTLPPFLIPWASKKPSGNLLYQ